MNLPDSSVLALIPECRARASRLRVLVFTMQPEDAYAVAALRVGAVGFLGKERPMEEVVAAVRAVGRGGRYVSDALAAKLLELPATRSPPSGSRWPSPAFDSGARQWGSRCDEALRLRAPSGGRAQAEACVTHVTPGGKPMPARRATGNPCIISLASASCFLASRRHRSVGPACRRRCRGSRRESETRRRSGRNGRCG